MPNVSLSWDAHWLRLVVVSATRGDKLPRLQRAQTIVLDDAQGEDETSTGVNHRDKLKAILPQLRIAKGDATVVVSRSDVEIRELELPAVPPEELPDLVRFQARTVFTSFHDDWLLDFVPLSSDESGQRVLAVALAPNRAKEIREIVEHAGLRLQHIVLRPFAAAEFLADTLEDKPCRLVVEPQGRQADISVVREQHVVLTRTVRVPETYTDEQFDGWLPDEIRRTQVAASNQQSARTVDEIVVFGDANGHVKLATELQEQFDIPSRFVDPFAELPANSGFEKPDRVDGFASLIGSLLQTGRSDNNAVDFLNPRKKPEKETDKQKLAILGGIAAVVLLGLGGFIWWMLADRSAKIEVLTGDINQLNDDLKKLEQQAARVEKVDEWKKLDINWLEQLRRLSTEFPDPELARLESFGGDVGLTDATIDVKAYLADRQALDALDESLLEQPYADVDVVSANVTEEAGFQLLVNRKLKLLPIDLSGIRPKPAAQDTTPAKSGDGESTGLSSAESTSENEEGN